MRCWLVFPFHVSTYPCLWTYRCCVLVDHSEGDVSPRPFSRVRLGEGAWAVQHWIWGARLRDLGAGEDMGKVQVLTCFCGSVEPIQRHNYPGGGNLGKNSWCCWSRYICCVFAWMSALLAQAFASYLGSGYRAKLVEYPIFDLWLLKRCLQRTSASVFGSLDPFSMTEIVVDRLKGAGLETGLRKAIITNDLSMPGLVDVVAKIVGVWPLVVSYLDETGRKDDGDSLVARSSTVGVLSALCKCAHHFFPVLEEMDGRVSIPRSTRVDEVQAVPSSSKNLETCKYHHHILNLIHVGT